MSESEIIGRLSAIWNHFNLRPIQGYSFDQIHEFGYDWPAILPPIEYTKEALQRLEDGGWLERLDGNLWQRVESQINTTAAKIQSNSQLWEIYGSLEKPRKAITMCSRKRHNSEQE